MYICICVCVALCICVYARVYTTVWACFARGARELLTLVRVYACVYRRGVLYWLSPIHILYILYIFTTTRSPLPIHTLRTPTTTFSTTISRIYPTHRKTAIRVYSYKVPVKWIRGLFAANHNASHLHLIG